MSILSRVIRFLFWLLVVSWSVALLRRLVAWMLRGGRPEAPTEGVEVAGRSETAGARRLIRDPVCGAHVAEVLSVPLREGGALLHFCSTACRDQYLLASAGKKQDAGTKKIAAAG
jgi:YHS domain-containing protein